MGTGVSPVFLGTESGTPICPCRTGSQEEKHTHWLHYRVVILLNTAIYIQCECCNTKHGHVPYPGWVIIPGTCGV